MARDDPFLRHEFLTALQDSGCVSAHSGWLPQFITLWDTDTLKGAVPLYLKYDSSGEFIFDWAWADAYERHGLRYYPKLVAAVPFTPVSGRRLLADSAPQRALLLAHALELARQMGVSSLHCLFPEHSQAEEMQAQGMLLRSGFQFHWSNGGYRDFDAYLAAMSHDKRKKIKQERRKVREAGITFEHFPGRQISEAQWAFFEQCYANTYRQHRSTPYLNLDFFLRIGTAAPDNLLMVVALRDGRPVAAALNFRGGQTLYGRYWGTTEHWPGLHFETCYYQAIEFCIDHGLAVFEGGAQGEHKLARGFLPVPTWSAHWLAHPEFSRAVEQFLAQEERGVIRHMDALHESNPFRHPT